MSACANRQYGTRAHKAKFYKIQDKVVKINQAIHDVLRGLYVTYLHFGLIFDQNLPFFKKRVLVRIELRGAIVELARETKMAQGSWSCEHCVRLLTFMLTRPQS